MAHRPGLLDLPTEILEHILMTLSTPSFLQLSVACKALLELSCSSRQVVLYHLQDVPGIKIGLDDNTVTTPDLFLALRQRASKHLFGANFTANCTEIRWRSSPVDVDASCLSDLETDSTAMSLILKDTLTIRLYGTQCELRKTIKSPFCGGKAKIIQAIHRKSMLAVLYQWEGETKRKTPPWTRKPLVKGHPFGRPGHDGDDAARSPVTSDSEDSQGESEDEPPKIVTKKRFYLQVYNHISLERPITYEIQPPGDDLVPRNFALNSRLSWAILWDSPDTKRPTDSTEIVMYNARRLQPTDEGSYDSRVLWPTEFDPRPAATTSDESLKGTITKRPVKIAFFKDGRRLSLYAPGDVVPFRVLGSSSLRESRLPTNLIPFENRTLFQVDTSFFGMHETYRDGEEDRDFCSTTHLCLAVGEITNSFRRCKILCILKSRSSMDHDDCPHDVEANRMNHVSAENCKAVARLWGWSDLDTSMTALDTVAISFYGTRIAVAQWDRVLIWSLDPQMLCEEVPDPESEEEARKSARRKKRPSTKGVAEEFYRRTKDKYMGWMIADLKPIVIDLKGAVARKMAWVIQSPPTEDLESDVSDADSKIENPIISNDGELDSNELDLTPSSDAEKSDIKKLTETGDPDSETSYNISSQATNETNTSVEEQKVILEPTVTNPRSDIATSTSQTPISKASSQESAASKPVSDRAIPILCSSRSRQVLNHEGKTTSEAGTIRTDSPKNTSAVILHSNAESRDEPFQGPPSPDGTLQKEVKAKEPSSSLDPVVRVVEANPSPLDKPSTEPKGKDKEKAHEAENQSSHDLGKRSKNLSQVEQKASKASRQKRFTEDELLIMTDRGFQRWTFDAWGKGLHTRQWLKEE